MADDLNPRPGGEMPPTDPPTPTIPVPGETPAPDSDGGEPYDKARAEALIAKLRAEAKAAKALEREVADLRAKVKADEDAKLSELERATRERDEAKATADEANRRLRERTLSLEIKLIAQGQNAVDADAVAKLLDQSAIEFDKDDQPTNVDALVKALLKDKPYLVKQEPKSGPPASPKPADGTALTEQQREAARLQNARAYAANF